MTGAVGGVIAAVTATAILMALAENLVPDDAVGEILSIAGSALIILTLLTALKDFHPVWAERAEETSLVEEAVAKGEETRRAETAGRICRKTEAYLKETLKDQGPDWEITLEGSLNAENVFAFDSARVGPVKERTQAQKQKAAEVICRTCGLSEEQLIWEDT